MAFLPKNLVTAQYLANSNGTLYTVPASTNAIIKKATVINSDASARTVTFYLVPSGGTADNSTILISAKSIPAGATVELFEMENHVLGAVGTIQGFASVASQVSVNISGIEQS